MESQQKQIIGAFVTCLICIFTILPAKACRVAHTRVFPSCDIPPPTKNERVSVVYAHRGAGLSDVAIENDASVTEVVDIKIGRSDKPHAIVLSSGYPLIWRFSGNIEQVSRVIVLGSQYAGAKYFGVMGVNPNIISNPKATLMPPLQPLGLPKGVTRGWTSCHSVYKACEASAYFEIPPAERMNVTPPNSKPNYMVDQFVEQIKAHTIHIPASGWLEEREWVITEGQLKNIPAGRYEQWRGALSRELSENYERGVLNIAPENVYSPLAVKKYDVLPGQLGLKQLIAKGHLLTPEHPKFKLAHLAWLSNMADRLGEEQELNINLDYLIAQKTVLPANFPTSRFLLAKGVEPVDLSNGAGYGTCAFHEDLSDIYVKRQENRNNQVPNYFHQLCINKVGFPSKYQSRLKPFGLEEIKK